MLTGFFCILSGAIDAPASRTANQKAMAFVRILIISVTLVVVAVPEGESPFHAALLRDHSLTVGPH